MSKHRSQVEVADHGMYLSNAGKGLRVVHGVDDAGVSASATRSPDCSPAHAILQALFEPTRTNQLDI